MRFVLTMLLLIPAWEAAFPAEPNPDVAELTRLSRLMNRTPLCGLGQSVAGPVESALKQGDLFLFVFSG